MATSIYKTILKRSNCLSSVEESVIDPNRKFDYISSLIEKDNINSYTLQTSVKEYLDIMCNRENASQYYWQPLDLAVKFNNVDARLSNSYIINNYINRVLPYVENMDNVSWKVYTTDLTAEQKSLLEAAIKEYKAADRILANHKAISKRYNIEKESTKEKLMGVKFLVESVGNMISTYNIPDYQKMNITIEESCYILEKNNSHDSNLDVARYALEYYLTQSPYISESDVNKFRKVISESYILECNNDQLDELYATECNSITSTMNSYILSSNKDIDQLRNMVSSIMKETSKQDIINNSDKITYLCWDLAKNKVFDDDKDVYGIPQLVSDTINKAIEENVTSYCKEDLKNIIESIEAAKKYIYSSGNISGEYTTSAYNYIKESVYPLLESLNETKDLLYHKANLDTIAYLESAGKECILERYNDTRYNTFIREVYNIDKFLKLKDSRYVGSNCIKTVLIERTATDYKDNILSYIGSDNKVDVTVRRYAYDESCIDSTSEFLNSVCNEYNDVLTSRSEMPRAYYIINPGIAEIRLKDPTVILMPESVSEGVMYDVDPTLCLYINDINESASICESITDVKSIEEMIDIMNKSDSFTYEQFKLALEAMSIIGVDQDIVSLFGSKFNDYQFNQTIKDGAINESYIALSKQEQLVKEDIAEYEPSDGVSLETKVETYNYLSAIFEYSYPTSADDDDDEDEDEEEAKKEVKKEDEDKKKEDNSKAAFDKLRDENKTIAKDAEQEVKDHAPKGGYKAKFSINDVKLALLGLKEKIKTLNTKDREAARNLDNAVRALVKGIKDSLVSNRREAIIKGSVIPSFSRCMKAALALAIVGHFSLPIAAIGAIGALALSKKLTKRERLLLLDEIETEMEVCDKELAIADSNNQIEKYRALLKYKKDLARQYQRIKYNIRIGKDILPGSTAGIGKADD